MPVFFDGRFLYFPVKSHLSKNQQQKNAKKTKYMMCHLYGYFVFLRF